MREIHRWIFLLGIFLLIVGIPTSRFLMSVGQLMLSVNWIIEGRYMQKINLLLKNPAVLWFLVIYLVHAVGLLYSEDLSNGLKDLRIKLPFLALPIILATAGPIRMREFRLFLLAFTGAVIFGSLRSLWELVMGEVIDIRNISVYISHIRFSLNICLAIFILFLSIYDRWYKRPIVLLAQGILLAWLLVFLILLQSFTGIIVFGLSLMVLLIVFGLRERQVFRRIVMVGIGVVIPLASGLYIYRLASDLLTPETVDFSTLEHYTPYGGWYHHDTLNQQTVNGYYIWLYLAEDELKDAWEERSDVPFNDTVSKDFALRDILIRYLSSRGLRKDADGVNALSDDEIQRIEVGVANARLEGMNPVKARLSQIIWEYENYRWTGDPTGHSVLMRYEYWKAAGGIISRNFFSGVGTGDLKIAFKKQYEVMDSELDPEWRLRSHNQYLSIFAAFGIFGFVLFLLAFLLPVSRTRAPSPFLFVAFLVIAMLSMITEDTLESQAGATFVAFFYCYLLFTRVSDAGS